MGRSCKTVRNTITLADGEQRNEDITACKNASGWEPAEV